MDNWNELIYSFFQYCKSDAPFQVFMSGITYEDTTYTITRRDCRTLSFEYIKSGEGTLEIDGKSIALGKNDVYILHKNTSYKYYSNPQNPWVKSWVVFGGTLAEAVFDAYIPEKLYHIENFDISAVMDKIVQIAGGKEEYAEKTYRIAALVLEIAQAVNRRVTRNELSLAERVEQLINLNVDNKLSLDRISRELNYSKNSIISAFRQRFGMTPYAYYENKRIENAKSYLSQTNLSIAQIAEKMSYSDRNYFSDVFKKSVGVSPAEYRRLSN